MVTVLDCLQWLEKSRKINDKDVVLCWHFHFLPFSQKVAPCVLKGNHSFFIVAVTKVSINHGQDRSVIVKTAILLGPGCTKQNFIFFAKKICQQEAISSMNCFFFFTKQVFSNVTKVQRCCQKDLEAYNFWSGIKRLCSLTAILCWVIFL